MTLYFGSDCGTMLDRLHEGDLVLTSESDILLLYLLNEQLLEICASVGLE